ncbi:3-isopropylmalate dehydrogenase [Ferrimicrobium acidiphilum]|jgi:3-isopropylmalate dehydrogenase|uniref:3-isopropylmalate dehydrogenase n=1 Tax=Ferrimicrobium acidiphilum TaxID=121039 RepID=UPI0023F398B5|nr:3-isopropylmalate dehydrogenase [Ferrimicrobium acidiphilum]MCL5053862.1 3-isopropylmalate dehydrogenase [Gammaproteobacteria bacterium]
MTHRIAVIGGDGIGPEVTKEAIKVARAAGASLETQDFQLGAAHYERTGEVLKDETLAELMSFDAILLGAIGPAIGSTTVPSGILERGLLLKLRFALDLYINQRPFLTLDPTLTTTHKPVDMIVIRENTEGAYVGEGGLLRKGTPYEVATQGSVNTRNGVERAIRFAFDLAQSRERKLLTLVHKTNVLTYSGDLWYRTFLEVASEYPAVITSYNHVDAACIYLVEAPERYDVIVTDNLFGDIITDLAAAVSQGIGYAASANINPERTGPSLFEPVHGAAHDRVGTGEANPYAAIRSAAMMLDFLGDTAIATKIEHALAVLPPAGATTTEIGDFYVERVTH